jgi:hypothetical protein
VNLFGCIWIVGQCASVRQCAAVLFVMCGSAHRNVRLSGRSAAVCGSVWQSAEVWQCGRIAAVRVWQYTVVWQCEAVRARVCGSARGRVRRCMAVRGAVCGSG